MQLLQPLSILCTVYVLLCLSCVLLHQALGSIHLNPATALAPIPVSSLPVLYRSLRGSEQVTPAEQEEVRGLRDTGGNCFDSCSQLNLSRTQLQQH